MKKRNKIIILISAIVIFAAGIYFFFAADFSRSDTVYGVTYSPEFSDNLGLDWQKTYLAILDDLKVKAVRIPVRWNTVEYKKGQFDFTKIDWLVSETGKRGVKVVLAIGRKVPRWPECHDPRWVLGLSGEEEIKTRLLAMIAEVVNRYKDNPAISYWQVENEPFVDWFCNDCPEPDKDFLKKEIALVKSLDSRPVMTTDSGELDTWFNAASVADIFGSTVYRVSWNKTFGYFHYWFFPPAYYHYHGLLIKKIYYLQKLVAAEVQAEPWSNLGLPNKISLLEQGKSMGEKQFTDNLNYAKKIGFDEAYFWGAEWWYWLKEKQGIDYYWDTAREFFINNK